MSGLETFNKLVVIAPSIEPDQSSDIDADRYGDMVANVFFGYLERDDKNSQIYILGGHMGALATGATWAEESTHRISTRLKDTYRLSSVIIRDEDEEVDLVSRISRGRGQYPEVLGEDAAKKRELGLITDGLQMELGRNALSQLGIHCASFEVKAPIFGNSKHPEVVTQAPVEVTPYIIASRPRRMAGDI